MAPGLGGRWGEAARKTARKEGREEREIEGEETRQQWRVGGGQINARCWKSIKSKKKVNLKKKKKKINN